MCMLTYYPEGVVPFDTTPIENGAEINNDGHGFAIVAGNRLIVKKGMAAAPLIEEFQKLRIQHPKGPALFHSRISTAGTIDLQNCHPFPFGNDRRTIVAHNGVLPKDAQPGKKDRRSDTRKAADSILGKRFGHLSMLRNRAALEQWVGGWNKLVILTVNPAYPRNGYLINEKSGEWSDGVWYSNSDYLGWERYAARWTSIRSQSWGTAKSADEVMPDNCEFCGDFGKITADGYCDTCTTCVDCGDVWDDCQCYNPDKVSMRLTDEEKYVEWWLKRQDQKTTTPAVT